MDRQRGEGTHYNEIFIFIIFLYGEGCVSSLVFCDYELVLVVLELCRIVVVVRSNVELQNPANPARGTASFLVAKVYMLTGLVSRIDARTDAHKKVAAKARRTCTYFPGSMIL